MSDLVKELFERGAHYGYSRQRRHPSVDPYLYGFKNRTAIINLEQTLASLARAEEFFRQLGKGNRRCLLVGTKPEARGAVAAAGERLNLSYVVTRWIGGTLTNFSEIKKRLARLGELKKQFTSGGLEKIYTKQERARFQKELDRLERSFSSIAALTELPAAVLVIDAAAEKIAVAEARLLRIPIIGLSGTDCDIRLIAYPIVANDSSVRTIEFIINRLAEAYELGRSEAIVEAPSVAVAAPVVVIDQ